MEPTSNKYRTLQKDDSRQASGNSQKSHASGPVSVTEANTYTSRHVKHNKNAPKPKSKSKMISKIIKCLSSTDPAHTIPLCTELNKSFLADGITPDERLISIQHGYKKSTLTRHQGPCTTEIPKDDTQGNTPKTSPSFARRCFNFAGSMAKGAISFPKTYRYFLSMCCKAFSGVLAGVDADDLNTLLMAMNQVHTRKTPQEIVLKKLHLPIFGPECEICNARMVLHEVSVPDTSLGYKHIRVKMEIKADIRYPSADGNSVSSRIELDTTEFDLDFKQDQVIKKLLTSGNLATTVMQLCGSVLYPYLPRVPGLSYLKKWRAKEGLPPETGNSASSLSDFLLPKQVCIKDTNFKAHISRDDQPEKSAAITVSAGQLRYGFDEDPRYFTARDLNFSMEGDQCGSLLPVEFEHSFASQIPFFHHDHTKASVRIPDLIIKNQEDSKLVVIPEAEVESEGDIHIENGKLCDIRVGFFSQPSGNKIISARIKEISADQANIPCSSFSVPSDQKGSFKASQANLTVVSSPTQSESGIEVIKEEGRTLVEKMKEFGWGILKSSQSDGQAAKKRRNEVHVQKMMAISAKSVERKSSDQAQTIGKAEDFGLLIDKDKQQIHLKARKINLSSTNPESTSPAENSPLPVMLKGQAEHFHLTANLEKTAESLCHIRAKRVKGDFGGPCDIKGANIDTIDLDIQQSSPDDYVLDACFSDAKAEKITFGALKDTTKLTAGDLHLKTDIHVRPVTENDHLEYEKFWQEPDSIMDRVHVHLYGDSIKASVMHQECNTATEHAKSPVSLVNTMEIMKPDLTVEVRKNAGDSDEISGTVKAETIEIKGEVDVDHILPNSEHVATLYQQMKNEVPDELKSILEEEISHYQLGKTAKPESVKNESRLLLHDGTIDFRKQGESIEGVLNLEKSTLDIKGNALGLGVTVEGIRAEHKGSDEISRLHVDKARLEHARMGTMNLSPKMDEQPVASMENILLENRKIAEETATDLYVENVAVDADLQTGASKTPVEVQVEKVALSRKTEESSEKAFLHVGHARIATHPEIKGETQDASVYVKEVSGVLNSSSEGKEKKWAAMAQKIAFKTKGLIDSSGQLKHIGVTATTTSEGVHIRHHIDNRRSKIDIHDAMPAMKLFQERNPSSLPVVMSITPQFEQADKLTGTVSIMCNGNVREMADYFHGRVKSRRARLALAIARKIGAQANLEIAVNQLPVNNGRISMDDIRKSTHIRLTNIRGFTRLFRPCLSVLTSLSWRTIQKQVKAMEKTEVIDEKGEFSLVDLLKTQGVFLGAPDGSTQFSFPETAPLFQRVHACLLLNQPLPENWNTESFIQVICVELESMYGEKTDFEQDFISFARLFVEKYGLPDTAGSFEKVMHTLENMKTMVILDDRKKSPLDYFQDQTG